MESVTYKISWRQRVNGTVRTCRPMSLNCTVYNSTCAGPLHMYFHPIIGRYRSSAVSGTKGKQSIYIAPFAYYVYPKALRHGSHSFVCKYIMPACGSVVSSCSGVRGGAPAINEFRGNWWPENRSGETYFKILRSWCK